MKLKFIFLYNCFVIFNIYKEVWICIWKKVFNLDEVLVLIEIFFNRFGWVCIVVFKFLILFLKFVVVI